jgi:hypothetical protein
MVYCKELVHITMEAVNLQDLQGELARLRPRGDGGHLKTSHLKTQAKPAVHFKP